MNIRVENFERCHVEEAKEIAFMNYEEERCQVPALPRIDNFPDLKHFADNQLGAAAFSGNRMLGFLCAYEPLEDTFGTTNVRGTFSPIHAHGVVPTEIIKRKGETDRYNKGRIYSLLYQQAAKKWVGRGIASHAIALYTHDREAINSFFCNGFGLRCIDAIRTLTDIPSEVDMDKSLLKICGYNEVPREKWGLLLEQHNGLISHLGESPAFMRFDLIDEEELYRRTSEDVRYFAAVVDDSFIAYIKISNDGENFATQDRTMMNICGAYCKPEYRGTGVYHNLLRYLMITLKNEGYHLLGVDCESINPTAYGFWPKYFTEYTHSLVRRIDDKYFQV
jgi:GNAT superfamily N-acetyltransferase